MTLIESLKAARRTATPLVAVVTPDPGSTIQTIRSAFEEGTAPIPLLRWDIGGGLMPLNKVAFETVSKMLNGAPPEDLPGMTGNPGACLNLLKNLPGEQVDAKDNITQRAPMVFFMNPQLFISTDNPDVPTIQGIWNLRDVFKADRRTLILLGTSMKLPSELAQDVIVFNEPTPNDEALADIINEQVSAVGVKLDDETKVQAVNCTRGLSAFVAEQITAMSVTENGLDLAALGDRQRAAIEQTRGLSVDRGSEDFSQIGGLEQFKRFGTQLLKSPRRPRVFVRIDELEKMLGGLGARGGPGDNTGVTQDSLGVLLREMEDNDWAGLLAVGPPGSGKSLVSKALGNSSNPRVLSISMDMGAMKAGRVGASEGMIRDAMRVIKGVAGDGGAFFIATVNKLDAIPPELRRRFRLGIWFFDLPTAEEREAIWPIALKRYGIDSKKSKLSEVDDTNLTGSDIRNICDITSRLGCSLKEAFNFITPVAVSDPESIDQLRNLANGRFLSASKVGVYRNSETLTQAAVIPIAGQQRRVSRRGEEVL